MEEKEPTHIELRSEEVQEIIGKVPSWTIRWGSTALLAIVILLLVGCYFFYYPDTLTAKVTLTTVPPPSKIYARSTGKLDLLFVRNHQSVTSGETLAVIRSEADYEHVDFLQQKISAWTEDQLDYNELIQWMDTTQLQLGAIEPYYITFFQQTLENTDEQKKNSSNRSLIAARNQLLASIKTWDIAHALRSPIDGKVNFVGNRVQNQDIDSGDLVFVITPYPTDSLVARALISDTGVGKIKTGQEVKISLNHYPDQEFGLMTGKVQNVSTVPDEEKQYMVEISLSDGLITNYGRELIFTFEMDGEAQIILQNKRMIERFIAPVRKLLAH